MVMMPFAVEVESEDKMSLVVQEERIPIARQNLIRPNVQALDQLRQRRAPGKTAVKRSEDARPGDPHMPVQQRYRVN